MLIHNPVMVRMFQLVFKFNALFRLERFTDVVHTAVKRKNPTPLPVFAPSNFVGVWRENLQDFCR